MAAAFPKFPEVISFLTVSLFPHCISGGKREGKGKGKERKGKGRKGEKEREKTHNPQFWIKQPLPEQSSEGSESLTRIDQVPAKWDQLPGDRRQPAPLISIGDSLILQSSSMLLFHQIMPFALVLLWLSGF